MITPGHKKNKSQGALGALASSYIDHDEAQRSQILCADEGGEMIQTPSFPAITISQYLSRDGPIGILIVTSMYIA